MWCNATHQVAAFLQKEMQPALVCSQNQGKTAQERELVKNYFKEMKRYL